MKNANPPAGRSPLNWFMLVLIAGMAAYAVTLYRHPAQSGRFVGSVARQFALPRLDGSAAKWSDYAGKSVVLAFWAYGCAPCRMEAPHLSELAERYRADGLAVLGVNAWNEPRAIVATFVKEAGLTHEILLEGASLAESYGVTGFPTVLWIDREGRIVDSIEGMAQPGELDQKTRQLLGK